MFKKVFKKTGAVLVMCSLLVTSIPVTAAQAISTNDTTNEVVQYSVIDKKKAPEQLNVHVGDDAATQVNVTYTTITDTSTIIAITKADGGETMYFEGTSYVGLGGKYIHEISVNGLEPATEYVYTVGDGFNERNGKFKTALEQGDESSFTFAYLADTQVSNASNAKALGATLAKVNEKNPDFVYLAGDVTDKSTNESQWEWLFNNDGVYSTGGEDMFANNLVAVTQGNHDNNEMYQHINAPEEAGKIVYSFDYGCAKFIILNLESARYDEDARAQQEAYLRDAVNDAKSNGQWTIVGFHKSLYTGASHITDSDIIAARKYWAPIFAETDVDLVLQGHDHVYSRGFVTAEGENANPTVLEDGTIIQPDAPLYMVGGHAGGLKWYSKKNYTVTENDPLALNYSFLDVNSTDTGSDVKKEQVITMLEVSNETISVKTTFFKYNTDEDAITTDEYVYDTFTVKRDLAECATAYADGTELFVKEIDDTLEYTVSFDNITNANAFETALEYDESVMELVKVESCLEDTLYVDEKTENGVSDYIIGTKTAISSDEKMDVVKYTFKLKEGAQADNVSVTLTKADTVNLENTDNGATADDIKASIIKDTVNTVIYSYKEASDINNDGKVTLADLSVALTYYQLTERSCDINLDGVVNALDYVIITSFIDR
ncbi:MAG: metallophosphoesterase [Acutalibacteraceae bacterium]|nr:metallophosphoesterase [Acutalibacteraceae bacterium]